MNTCNDSLLIASAPTEVLIGLGLFFCIAGAVLFALAVEAGNYPQVLNWIQRGRQISFPPWRMTHCRPAWWTDSSV